MSMYIVYFAIIMLLPLYAQMKVKGTYNKFAKQRTMKGQTGAEVARAILDANGLYDVRVVPTQGVLSDHYNPATKQWLYQKVIFMKRVLQVLRLLPMR